MSDISTWPLGSEGSGFPETLLPKKPLPPGFPGAIPNEGNSTLFKYASALADVKFGNRTVKEIYELYFPFSKLLSKNGINIFTDPDCECSEEEIMEYTSRFFGGPVLQGAINPVVTFTIYVSKYENKLTTAFECAKAASNEVVLFLEDNTGDISGTYLRARIGTDVIQLLGGNSSHLYSDVMQKSIKETSGYEIDKDVLKELVEKGYVENTTLEIISYIIGGNNLMAPIKNAAFNGIADALGSVVEFLEKNVKFQEHHWNPNAGGKENKDFEPALFPGSNGLLASIDDSEINNFIKSGVDSLEKFFLEKDKEIQNFLGGDIGQVNVNLGIFKIEFDLFPDTVETFVRDNYNKAKEVILAKFAEIKELDFTDMLKKGLWVCNAFMCGLWNSLVDAISGIFSILQMIFMGSAKVEALKANFSKEFPLLLGQFDDMREAIGEINFKEVFNSFVDKIRNVDPFDVLTSIPMVNLAYYTGAVVGFIVTLIVEIVIGILISGGALSVAVVVEELVNMFASLIRLGTQAVKGAVKVGQKLGKAVIKNFTQAINALLKLLQQGTKGFVKMIDDLWKWLEDALGLVKKTSDEAASFGDELEELLRRVTTYDKQGGKLLNKKALKHLKNELWDKYKVRLKFVDKDHALRAKRQKWIDPDTGEFQTVGSFRPGPPPEMFLLEGQASELTVFHEMVHLEVWYKKFPKMHIIDEEKFVWDAIWKMKSRWTDDELYASYKYVNDMVDGYVDDLTKALEKKFVKEMDPSLARQKAREEATKRFPKLEIPEMEQIKFTKFLF